MKLSTPISTGLLACLLWLMPFAAGGAELAPTNQPPANTNQPAATSNGGAVIEADHHGADDAQDHGVDGKALEVYWVIPFVGMLLSIAIFPLVKPLFWHHHYGKVAAAWIAIFAVPFLVAHGGHAFYEILHIVLLDFVPFIILLAALFTAAGGICVKGSLRGSPGVNTAILAIGTALASWMGTTGAAMLLIRPILRANAWRKHQVHVVVFFIFLVANIGGSLTPLGDPPLFLGFLKGVEFFWTMKLLPVMAPVALVLLGIFYLVDRHFFSKEGLPPDDGEKKPLGLDGGVNFAMIACIIGAIIFSKSLADGPFKKEEAALKYDHKISVAEIEEAQEKKKLKQFVENELPNLSGEEADAKLGPLRRKHLLAVTKVNKLRAHRTHDETMGPKIYGVIVPWANLVRDGLLIFIAWISLKLTPMYRSVRDDHGNEVPADGEEETNVRAANGFTWEPILEVAKLFIAIFICMIPALKILQAGVDGSLKGVVLSVQTTMNDPINTMYFWYTGVLSSFLDNAPTYVVFFNTAGGDPTSLMGGEGAMSKLFDLETGKTLLAISCGAVFMGANTYIGNAPNFMVKAIAEENGVKMPSFFGYMAWSFCILVPIFIAVSYFYFRG